MSCSSSCQAAAAAALARRDAPRSASRGPRPMAPEPCYPASAGLRSRPSRQPSSRRIRLCGTCGCRARILREDRSRPAARARRPVRLRGADRGWRGRQHREGRAGPIGRGGGSGRRRLKRRPRRETRRRASDRRGRFIGRQARLRRETRRDPHGQRRARPTRPVRYAASPAAGSTSPSTWPAPLRRWSSPMRRPPAAGRP